MCVCVCVLIMMLSFTLSLISVVPLQSHKILHNVYNVIPVSVSRSEASLNAKRFIHGLRYVRVLITWPGPDVNPSVSGSGEGRLRPPTGSQPPYCGRLWTATCEGWLHPLLRPAEADCTSGEEGIQETPVNLWFKKKKFMLRKTWYLMHFFILWMLDQSCLCICIKPRPSFVYCAVIKSVSLVSLICPYWKVPSLLPHNQMSC